VTLARLRNRSDVGRHRDAAVGYRVAVLVEVPPVKIRVEWGCGRCAARLVTHTRLSAPPVHRCGAKRAVPMVSDDPELEKKALGRE
jgi:hypothetical protein